MPLLSNDRFCLFLSFILLHLYCLLYATIFVPSCINIHFHFSDLFVHYFHYVQETIFVPYITAFISKKEQERFNRGVISNLGFIRAQVNFFSSFHLLAPLFISGCSPRFTSFIPYLSQCVLSLTVSGLIVTCPIF